MSGSPPIETVKLTVFYPFVPLPDYGYSITSSARENAWAWEISTWLTWRKARFHLTA